MRALLITAVTLCLVVSASPGGPPADVAQLIRQLGSDDYAEREAAHQKIEALGESALDALRKAASESDDPEVKSRAQRLRTAITARGLRDEAQALQGVWKLVQVGERGNGMSVQDNDSLRITFSGEQYAWRGTGFLGFVNAGGRYELGRALGANALDFHASGRGPMLTLYAVEGDTLRLCVDVTQDHQRPEKLEAGRGSWPMLLTLSRVSR